VLLVLLILVEAATEPVLQVLSQELHVSSCHLAWHEC
jgi:hypothetical protein